jgi:hypothetical protein
MSGRRAALVLTLVFGAAHGAGAVGGCPSDSIDDVMHDSRVREAMDQMWTDSHEGQPDEHEEGAWVYQCQMSNGDGTYRYYTLVQRWPHGTVDSTPPSPMQADANCRLVAYVHTHPGVGQKDPDSNDEFDNNHPSPADKTFADQYGVPGILRYGHGSDTTDLSFGGLDEPRAPTWDCPEAAASGSGGSMGDPHVRTLDGYTYDFQAIGDFFLLRSTAGDLEIQVRQQPYHALRTAAINGALAVGDGHNRVVWTTSAGPMVNGVAVAVSAGADVSLPGHLVLRRSGDDDVLFTAMGDRVTVTPSAEGLDFSVRIAHRRRGAVRGLLGNGDGDPDNDLVTSDGRLVTLYSTDKDDATAPIYAAFGNSWRVPGQSMFTPAFAPPANVDVRAFPYPAEEVTPERRAAARQDCAAHGLTDPLALDNCVFDAVATGSSAFMASSARAERAGAAPPPATPGTAAAPDREFTGALDPSHPTASYTLALAAGTYFFDARGSRGTAWTVRAPDRAEVLDANQAAFMGEYPARLTLARGTYTIAVSAQPNVDHGRYRFRVRTVPVSPPRTLALGAEAAGRIAAVGEEHRYRLGLQPGRYDFLSLAADNVRWSLTSPTGEELLDASQQETMEDVRDFPIASRGTFTLTISGRGMTGLGSYRVKVVGK